MPKKQKDKVTIRSSAAEYLTFIAAIGENQESVEMRYENENIRFPQKMMAVSISTIDQHIKKNEDHELESSSEYLITAIGGKTYNTKHYFLRMVIVGQELKKNRRELSKERSTTRNGYRL